MPVSKPPRKKPNARAQVAGPPEKSTPKLTPTQYQRRRYLGFGLIALGVIVFLQHLVSHMGFFTVFSGGWDDLLIGYPLAAALVIVGGVLLSKT